MNGKLLVCGHWYGFLSLTKLKKMKVLSQEQLHTEVILCISSNSKYVLCGSKDGDACLLERPALGETGFSLVKKMVNPLKGRHV